MRRATWRGGAPAAGRGGPAQAAAALAAALAIAIAGGAGCRRATPDAAEVRLHATVGDRAVDAVAQAAAQRGLARVRRVAGAAEAEVLWLRDPTEVVALGAAIADGSAPDAPDVPARFRDPRGRFAPLCGRARVLVVSPRAALPFAPAHLRDLADGRLAGRIAVAPPAGEDALALAALALAHGEASVRRFLDLLAANRPVLARDDAEVRALVARGAADVGLTSSEEAAAGAVSAAALEVVYPDQDGRGAVVIPTAVAVRGAAPSAAASALAAFLAGSDAERLVAARAPGLLPLRGDAPVPVGVRPAAHLRALRVDWDELARERDRLAATLRSWAVRE